MRINILLAIASSICLFNCKQNSPEPKLVWADEFNVAGKPDTLKWNYSLGVGNPNGWGNNELECYTNDSKNVRVENSKLIIEAHKDSLEGKPYTSARINTKKKGDWLYGRIEAKAKLPYGKGTWPAIWMLSTDWKYGGWPASGEIDIMEHVGYDQNVIHGTIHTEAYNHMKNTQKEGKITSTDVSNTFHVYAINWSQDKIEFAVDDKIYHTVTKANGEDYKGWPFDQSFYLILNLAVGGGWGGREGVDETIWPQHMEVDYVRIYQ
jgi:beta-glucanase (GH16 family)